jgi:tetratricopeptide (TPR) repeat protein
LAVDPDRIDAFRFERLAAQGRERLPDDPGGAARLLREALALWMGPPLEEFAGQPFADTEIARLNELRLTAVEDRFDAELMLGRHAAAAGELREHVRAHPLRERLVGQLMLALYRSGRQAEALAAHQRARAMLVDELGVDPGPALRRLEQQILRQDQALEWRARSERQAAATIDSQAAAPNPAPSRDEQRWVTVVRAHVDATDGAEAVAARFPERLRREVRRHGGALVDDGAAALTAVFGAPVAHEDDAQRAVRAMRAVTNFAGSVSLAAAPVTVRAEDRHRLGQRRARAVLRGLQRARRRRRGRRRAGCRSPSRGGRRR